MPRSVNWPLRHMSHSPRAQHGHGTGSGRRTTPMTRSPALCLLHSGACTTRPSDSWPRVSRSWRWGVSPCSRASISRSVPQMPRAIASTSRSRSPGSGSWTSVTATDPASPGLTVMARIARPAYPASDDLEQDERAGGHARRVGRIAGQVGGAHADLVGALRKAVTALEREGPARVAQRGGVVGRARARPLGQLRGGRRVLAGGRLGGGAPGLLVLAVAVVLLLLGLLGRARVADRHLDRLQPGLVG